MEERSKHVFTKLCLEFGENGKRKLPENKRASQHTKVSKINESLKNVNYKALLIN